MEVLKTILNVDNCLFIDMLADARYQVRHIDNVIGTFTHLDFALVLVLERIAEKVVRHEHEYDSPIDYLNFFEVIPHQIKKLEAEIARLRGKRLWLEKKFVAAIDQISFPGRFTYNGHLYEVDFAERTFKLLGEVKDITTILQ